MRIYQDHRGRGVLPVLVNRKSFEFSIVGWAETRDENRKSKYLKAAGMTVFLGDGLFAKSAAEPTCGLCDCEDINDQDSQRQP